MAAIRSGGIASGLDTNAIIDSLVGAAKEPINALEAKNHLLSLTKDVFKEVSADLTSLKSTVFNLKLESTFRSKNVDSSNSAVASAIVTPEAAAGSHAIEVVRTAKQASMTSLFSKPTLIREGAGATEYSEWPGKYVQLEGDITTTIKDTGSMWTATSEFKPVNSAAYTTQTFSTPIDATLIDQYGSIQPGVLLSAMGTMQFEMTVNGGPTVTLDTFSLNSSVVSQLGTDETSTVKDINHLVSGLEQGLNDQINTYFGTTDMQYIAMQAEFDGTNWYTKIYDVSEQGIKLNAATGTTHTAVIAMGLTGAAVDGTASTIKKYQAAANAAGLEAKLEDRNSSIVYKAALNFDTLTEGTFETRLDASMNVEKGKPTTITGEAFSHALSLNAPMTSSSGLGLTSAQETALTSGKFTINGVTIDLSRYSALNANAIMGIVNGAGANVTMSYDDAQKAFVLKAASNGAQNITLGADSDTSPFFDLFKLDRRIAAFEYGTDGGSLDTTRTLIDAGMPAVTAGVFSVNDIPIYVDPKVDTVDDLLDKVNKSGAGVQLSYDKSNDKFVIVSVKGADRIKFGGAADTTDMLRALGFTAQPNITKEMGEKGYKAIVKIDGQTYQRDTNTVDDVLEGVTLNLSSTGMTSINITVDTGKAVQQLANLVKTYNTIMDKFKYSEIERRDRQDYMAPLTEEKKSKMSEKEIEEYEKRYDELHKQDIINRSTELKSVTRDIRRNLMAALEGNSSGFLNLAVLGLDIAGEDWTEKKEGKLLVDSTDLDEIKERIEANTDLMKNLRDKSDDVYTFFAEYKEEGDRAIEESWARRYEKMITRMLDIEGPVGMKTRVDSAIDAQQRRTAQQIETVQRRAEDYLERLWSQFTAMEQRVAESQSRGDYIAQMAQRMSNSSGSSKK